MLLVIIGMAVIVTMTVTAKVSQQEAQYEAKHGRTAARSASYSRAPVIVANDTIEAGATIEKDMVHQVRLREKEIFDDSLTTVPNVVGRKVKNEIPAEGQIRESDLD